MSTTFTRRTTTYDDTTGVATSTTSTITGAAIRVRGRSDTYRALSLIESQAPTLLFTPDTYGDVPLMGDTVEWPDDSGTLYTVRDVDPIAPDGVVIMARVVVAR